VAGLEVRVDIVKSCEPIILASDALNPKTGQVHPTLDLGDASPWRGVPRAPPNCWVCLPALRVAGRRLGHPKAGACRTP